MSDPSSSTDAGGHDAASANSALSWVGDLESDWLYQETFRLIMAESPIGMTLLDLDGRWLQVNDAMCEIVGYSREELLQLNFQDITHPEDLDEDLALVAALVAGDIPNYQIEKRYLRKNGEIVWVLLAVSLVRSRDGEPHYFISQVQDITGRKRARRKLEVAIEELRSSNADLERFAQIAGHDLRSPLSTARGFVEMLLEHAELTDDQTEWAERARRSIDRTLALTGDILNMARVGSRELSPQTVAPTKIAETVLDELYIGLPDEVQVEVGDIPLVRVDPGLLRIALQNIIENAIKYQRHGRVWVAVTGYASGDDVVITVDDAGPGIPENDLERVFQPFVRSATPDPQPGTGLGLAICRRIAERSGGSIHAERRAEGGSRIVLRLPAPMKRTTEQ